MPVKTRSQIKNESVSSGYSADQQVRRDGSCETAWIPRNAKGYPSVGQLTLKQIKDKNNKNE